MPDDWAKSFISLPDIGEVTDEEAEVFIRGEVMFIAEKRRQAVDELLHTFGFKPLDKDGSQPLDQLISCLENQGLLDESGSLLGSAGATLRQGAKSDIYFLGLNPGGDVSEDQSVLNNFPTIYESLAMSRMGVSGWDQDWSRKGASYRPGEAPIQKRFKHIARFLGLAYGEIFATNLAFARSSRFKALPNVEDQIKACLPVHEMMIKLVQPKRLWVMGNTDSAGIALKLKGDVEWIAADYAKWSIGHGTVEFCDQTMTLCHTPHLTFWDATDPAKQALLKFAFHGVRPDQVSD